jgi:hypothetical protein
MRGYITNGITQDGFGARIQRALHTMAFTQYLNDVYKVDLEYIHTPFSYEGFEEDYSVGERDRELGDNKYPYDEISREGYLKRALLWDSFLNYTGLKITDIDLNTHNCINCDDFGKLKLINDLRNGNSSNNIYIVKYLQPEFNSFIFNTNIVDYYKDKILKNFNFTFEKTNNIIIHIRRKDAIYHGDARYLNDEYYLSILKDLEPIKEYYNITIRTQRKNFNPEVYKDYTIIYDDEEEDYNLFKDMINAEILVMGKSSFSLAAGMINRNIVVYPQQITPPLDRWVNSQQLSEMIKNTK